MVDEERRQSACGHDVNLRAKDMSMLARSDAVKEGFVDKFL